MKAKSNLIFLERVKLDTKTSGGIHIELPEDDKPEIGRVVTAGPGNKDRFGKLREMPFKPGDILLFNKHSSAKIKIDGNKDIWVITDRDVLARYSGPVPEQVA